MKSLQQLYDLKEKWQEDHPGRYVVDGLIEMMSSQIENINESTLESAVHTMELWKNEAIDVALSTDAEHADSFAVTLEGMKISIKLSGLAYD